MIVTGRVSVPRAFLDLSRPLLLIMLVAVSVVAVHDRLGKSWISISVTPLTVIGAALSIFIVFRNNAVYDRYWEGRNLWGRLVNASRTWARQLVTFVVPPPDCGDDEKNAAARFRRDLTYCQIAYAQSLRVHLRDDEDHDVAGLEQFLTPEEIAFFKTQRNVPAALLHAMGERIQGAWRRGWIRDYHLPALDATLTEISTIQGGCERIKNTPLPPVYTYLANRIVIGYCCILPFGLVADLGLATLFVTLFISFAFLILDRISFLLETPFGLRSNDLPLAALARVIEIDLRERLGEKDAPPSLKPEKGVLL